MEIRQDALALIDAENNGSTPVPIGSDGQLLEDFVKHIAGERTGVIDAASTLALTNACLRARQSAHERRVVAFDD
jgi:hypothetical protein